MSEGDHNKYGSSKAPLKELIARVASLVCLIVSIAVLKTNDITIPYDGIDVIVTYKNFRSYKYMFYVMIIGVVYTLLQIPFALYYMRTKKHLIEHYVVLKFDFYADKVLVLMLATGVGATFGSTMDMKKLLAANETKMQEFLTMMYVSAAFLLVACFTSTISSIHSSLALSKN